MSTEIEVRLPEYLHSHGCPAPPDRIERCEVPRPDDQGGGTFEVIRCIECGGQSSRLKEVDDG